MIDTRKRARTCVLFQKGTKTQDVIFGENILPHKKILTALNSKVKTFEVFFISAQHCFMKRTNALLTIKLETTLLIDFAPACGWIKARHV